MNVMLSVLFVPNTVSVAVRPANVAVRSLNGTSIKCHAVPIFATAHSRVCVPGTGKNKFDALAVRVVPLKVMTLLAFFGHGPRKDASLIALALSITCLRKESDPAADRAPSTARTTRAIRSAAGRVNEIRSGIAHSGSPSASISRRLSTAIRTTA
jgi:hypothetical protein